jgi:glycosyltransferase involved in cell wall biosynthesis
MPPTRREPLVTVVTPFYNTEEYLAECIESVLKQTYANWHYILVDNCSTDGSSEIARRYASRDNRIRLIRNETFLGQVQNYNAALRHVPEESDFCKMVQADDWIYPDCLEKMVAAFEEDASIAVVSARYQIGASGPSKGPGGTWTMIRGRDLVRLHLLRQAPGAIASPTTVMYRSSAVRNRVPFYSESSLHEDIEVCYELLLSWNLGFVRDVLTFVRTDNDSITLRNAPLNPDLLDHYIRVKKYGPLFLSPSEFRAELEARENDYLKMLGKSVFYRWDARFWSYHRDGLMTVGTRLGPGLIARAIMTVARAALQKPLRLIERRRELNATA